LRSLDRSKSSERAQEASKWTASLVVEKYLSTRLVSGLAETHARAEARCQPALPPPNEVGWEIQFQDEQI